MTSSYKAWGTAEIARRILKDIPEGAYVNLGIGRPMAVSNHLSDDKEIIVQCENGILGVGRLAEGDQIDPSIVNAGKQAVTLRKGAAFFHHADSFAMIRGGHIDICVLGAFQVSVTGDLANWRTLDKDAIPAVGGAMDLARGAKRVFVMMEHLNAGGESKVVQHCTYPLTGVAVVDRIYTDLAVLQITPAGAIVVERVAGLSHETLERISGVSLGRG